jgi:hypothetical protein
MEVINNEVFWDHVAAVTTAFMPMLFLLRLADRNIPAMDQLFYYVRKMDSTINKTKEVVDVIEGIIKGWCTRNGTGTGTLTSKDIIKFYLSKSSSNTSALRNQVASLNTAAALHATAGADSDSDSEGGDDGEIPDDFIADGEDDVDVDVVTHGQQIKSYWEKRSKHLRHDIAIAAWICSPIPEVMEDSKLYGAAEVDAVERVIQKWMLTSTVGPMRSFTFLLL